MAEATPTPPADFHHDAATVHHAESGLVVAIILPCIFGGLLLCLVLIGLYVRYYMRTHSDDQATRDRKRMERLEYTARRQTFAEWVSRTKKGTVVSEKEVDEESADGEATVCVICLDRLSPTSIIRTLRCSHVFHQTCLDDWFGRWHDYCPLCHRKIVDIKSKYTQETQMQIEEQRRRQAAYFELPVTTMRSTTTMTTTTTTTTERRTDDIRRMQDMPQSAFGC